MKSLITPQERALTRAEFQDLADVPAEAEWFANIKNPNTRRAYRNDIKEFFQFVGIEQPGELRAVKRAHVIAWRDEHLERELSASTIRRKLAALSSLFDYLCEKNAVLANVVDGVKRPSENVRKGKTPALSDAQVIKLLDSIDQSTLQGKRDSALLSVAVFHAFRRDEICKLKIEDRETREGALCFTVQGKGGKTRYIPVHPHSRRLIDDYIEALGLEPTDDGPLFRPVRNNTTGTLNKPLTTDAVYKIMRKYGHLSGLERDIRSVRPHVMRATAATNALKNGADIKEVQEWLGHEDISTTRMYDRRDSAPEDSPTFRVKYAGSKKYK